MIVSIHQPQYWPWPRYIHKVMSCDVFVYLDTVQFSKNGYQNRNQIKIAKGSSWLTTPVTHQFGQTILDTKIADPAALEKHYKTLTHAYSGTPGYQKWKDELHELLHGQPDSLCDISVATTEWMLGKLGVQTPRLKASDIPNIDGHGSELIASICGSLEATSYMAGDGSLDYMNHSDFLDIGCDVLVQQWSTLVYDQAYPQIGFIPDLSTLDLLLNCPDTSAQLIQSTGTWKMLEPIE